jgi:DNA-binding transcriptional LysR family regulator
MHDLSTEEMLRGIREGRLELAFVVQPGRAMLRGLEFEELARDRMRLAVAPEHPLAKSRSISIARAAEEPLVSFSRKEYPEYQEYLDALFGHKGVRIAEEHDSSASLIAAVQAGVGAAVVPESFSCSAGPRLKLIPISPEPKPVVIGAAWVRQGLTTKAEAFLAAARRGAASLRQPKEIREP